MPNFDTCEFTGNRYRQPRIDLEVVLEGFWRLFRDFRAISRTYQNWPCSKPWAIDQGFCSQTAKFRPLGIHPKSKETVPQRLKNNFIRVLEPFQKVWSDLQDLPKSTMFKKPWAIAQGFCSKTANFRPLRIHPKSTQTVPQRLKNNLSGFWSRFREFGEISRTYQNRPCSKPWAIAQGSCPKTAKFRPLRIHPKSTQTVPQLLKNNFIRVLKPFQRVWSDFQDIPKSTMFKTMGYSPGFLLKNSKISTLANSPEIDTDSAATT